MKPYSSDNPFCKLAEALCVSGYDGKRLIKAHVDGILTLTGRRRKGSQLGDREPIPKEYFADSVTLNPQANCIGPDGSVESFKEFEHNQGLTWWEEVRVATAEVQALNKVVECPSGTQRIAERKLLLVDAIERRFEKGEVPGSKVPWKSFCDGLRDECDGWDDRAQGRHKRGFGDKTIQRTWVKCSHIQ